jgi:predicted DNA-binding transcriptional regulator AlpA
MEKQHGVAPLQRRALSIPQMVEVFGYSRASLYNEFAAGRLRKTKMGRRTVIAVEDAQAWFDAKREGGAK